VSDERIVVGSLAGAFGVRGEVRLKSFCAEPADIAGYAPLYTPDGRVFRDIRIIGETQGSLTARIAGGFLQGGGRRAAGHPAPGRQGPPAHASRGRILPRDLNRPAVHDPGGALLGQVRAVLNHARATSWRSRDRAAPRR
jgi:16S rRNA processing protein RimM